MTKSNTSFSWLQSCSIWKFHRPDTIDSLQNVSDYSTATCMLSTPPRSELYSRKQGKWDSKSSQEGQTRNVEHFQSHNTGLLSFRTFLVQNETCIKIYNTWMMPVVWKAVKRRKNAAPSMRTLMKFQLSAILMSCVDHLALYSTVQLKPLVVKSSRGNLRQVPVGHSLINRYAVLSLNAHTWLSPNQTKARKKNHLCCGTPETRIWHIRWTCKGESNYKTSYVSVPSSKHAC